MFKDGAYVLLSSFNGVPCNLVYSSFARASFYAFKSKRYLWQYVAVVRSITVSLLENGALAC